MAQRRGQSRSNLSRSSDRAGGEGGINAIFKEELLGRLNKINIEAVTLNKLPATAAVTTEEVGLRASPVVQPLVGPALPPLATPLTSTLYASLDQAHSRSVGPAPDPRLLKQR